MNAHLTWQTSFPSICNFFKFRPIQSHVFGRGCIFWASTSALVGCALHPQTEDFSRSTIPAIVYQIRCEAKEALESYVPRERDHLNLAVLTYNFEFNMTENNDANSNMGSVAIPITNGTLTLGWSAGVQKQRLAKQDVDFSDTFEDLENLDCDSASLRRNYVYPISGHIGLLEVFRNFVLVAEQKPGIFLNNFSDEVRFKTIFNATATGSVVLTPAAGRRITANAAVSAKRTDDHRLILTFEPGLTDQQYAQAAAATAEALKEARDQELADLQEEKEIPAIVQIVDADGDVIEPPFQIVGAPSKAGGRREGVSPGEGTDSSRRTKRKPRRLIQRKGSRATIRPLSKIELIRRAREKANRQQSLGRQRELRNLADELQVLP